MLKSRLPQIARSLDNEIAPAMRIAADAIEEGAKSRVPVDTGDLRDAIHTEKTDDGYAVVAGTRDIFYAHIIEHGSTRLPPRPFLIPAAESVRANIDNLVRTALRDL